MFDDRIPVVLPLAMGAAVDSPHLALKAEAMTVRALAQRLIDRLPVVGAPVLDFGVYSAGAGAGLFSAICTALVRELVHRLRTAGGRRFVLLADGAAASTLTALTAEDLLIVEVGRTGRAAERLLEAPEKDRARERLTSILLGVDPRAVRMKRLETTSPASAFKGERLLEARTEDVMATIMARWPDLAASRMRN